MRKRKIDSIDEIEKEIQILLEKVVKFYEIKKFYYNLLTSKPTRIKHQLLSNGVPHHIIELFVALMSQYQNIKNEKETSFSEIKEIIKQLRNISELTQGPITLDHPNTIIEQLIALEESADYKPKNSQSAISQACEIVNSLKDKDSTISQDCETTESLGNKKSDDENPWEKDNDWTF